jgi:3-dehydroquinate dehydratase / shikimate dehydrogenase
MPALPKSLPRICVALGFTSPASLGQAADCEFRDGNTFLEFRLDYLSSPESGVALIETFLKTRPEANVLATCRLSAHNGHFGGTIDQQIRLLAKAAAAGACVLDLEIESAERATSAVQSLREHTPVVVSYHNFDSTPSLEPVLRRLMRVGADAYKIATLARKPTDSLRLVDFLKDHHKTPLIAFAMSDQGLCTRVLSPGLGGIFTYAAPGEADGTAPGQVPARVMKSLYRLDKLTKGSHVYGVIGDPVGHSKSPHVHNRAFQARWIDAVYLPFHVTQAQLGDFMKLAAKLPVSGFSVTIPHKQKILRYLDHVGPLAKRIGAVNTVWRKAGRWRGTNTDVDGVLKPLSRHLRLGHATVLVAGCGGAARAAAFALRDAGADVTVTGRDLRRASVLAKAVNAKVVSLAQASDAAYDALVHATPVGMHPKVDDNLFPDSIPADVVFDMVYNPHETQLLKHASEQGCEIIYGASMFLEQAAQQFEIWSGETAPRLVMQKALEAC